MTTEIGPTHPLTYRQEVVAPLYDHIRAGASTAVIGSSSMGKSRLLHFLMRGDVREHYLPDRASRLLFVWADQHRLAKPTEWAFFELLLTALVEAVENQTLAREATARLDKLRYQVVTTENELLARRNVELATQILCKKHGYQLCFLLDEFDEIYRTLPATALTNLRALRDTHKYQLSYLLLMRDTPDNLRDPRDHEGFYELYSRNLLGLGPYQREDARRIVQQLEMRKSVPLTEATRRAILHLAGGHPGLLVALTSIARREQSADWQNWQSWLPEQPLVSEECLKLWLGLNDDERATLLDIADGSTKYESDGLKTLQLKGLVCSAENQLHIFNPLLNHFVQKQQPILSLYEIEVDALHDAVRVGRRTVETLTKREFELLQYFYARLGEVCTREEMLTHLYSTETIDTANDNRIDDLVRKIRKKIEPAPRHPRYLLTVRGKGYRLIDATSSVTKSIPA